MKKRSARVESLHVGAEGTLAKSATTELEFALDGIVGDRHRGLSRIAWEHDKQPEGTLRRNERQWSAIASDELAAIGESMQLSTPLSAAAIGVNICLSGIAGLSRLPRGTLLQFESGVILMVEEYNPPCMDMGEKLAAEYARTDSQPISPQAFSQAARFSRGIVGVIEVAGRISAGEAVTIVAEDIPRWLRMNPSN